MPWNSAMEPYNPDFSLLEPWNPTPLWDTEYSSFGSDKEHSTNGKKSLNFTSPEVDTSENPTRVTFLTWSVLVFSCSSITAFFKTVFWALCYKWKLTYRYWSQENHTPHPHPLWVNIDRCIRSLQSTQKHAFFVVRGKFSDFKLM